MIAIVRSWGRLFRCESGDLYAAHLRAAHGPEGAASASASRAWVE